MLTHHDQILASSQNLTAMMSQAAARAAADTCSVQGKFCHEVCKRLLIMTDHGQQQEDSPNDAVDEHGQQQQEGEEGRRPLEVDDDDQDEHQRNEDHHREVDVLRRHAAAEHAVTHLLFVAVHAAGC